jgi:hypothetical protein
MNTPRPHSGTTCSACSSPDLLSVSITMADGPVRFWTCSICEVTGWEREGSTVAREAALANLPRR